MVSRRSILAVAAILLSVLAFSQENRSWKRFESIVQVGGGLFLETGTDYRIDNQNPGAVLRLSYGLDMRVDEKWSFMPGVGIRKQEGGILHNERGDNVVSADCFVAARYHIGSDRFRMVLGLGPSFSYMVLPVYLGFSNVQVEKFRRFDVGIQPSAVFLRGDHLQWGLEANIGRKDLLIKHWEYDTPFGSTYLHYLAVVCGWRF